MYWTKLDAGKELRNALQNVFRTQTENSLTCAHLMHYTLILKHRIRTIK